MSDTTRHMYIEMGENLSNSLDPESILSSHCPTDQLCLSGETSSMIAASRELIAQYSEMNPKFYQAPLSIRLTPLLIFFGLVKGTTLTFGRRLSSLRIQGIVSYARDGSVVAIPKQDYMF